MGKDLDIAFYCIHSEKLLESNDKPVAIYVKKAAIVEKHHIHVMEGLAHKTFCIASCTSNFTEE